MASIRVMEERERGKIDSIPIRTGKQADSQGLDTALSRLRESGYGPAADVLLARVNQEQQKMKLTPDEAVAIAGYLQEDLGRMPNCARLLETMPRATVEIVRASRERDVSMEDAEDIARYLSNFLAMMDLGNARRFDESVSHVIGRTYEQIDWSGENTSAEEQRRDWSRYGVPDFKTAEHYHNYLRHAVTMRWFARAFQPHGTLPEDFEDVLNRGE
ncbi:MAG: hypothetical protein V1861_04350 [Candidatus Micrarchaeota archaeon]